MHEKRPVTGAFFCVGCAVCAVCTVCTVCEVGAVCPADAIEAWLTKAIRVLASAALFERSIPGRRSARGLQRIDQVQAHGGAGNVRVALGNGVVDLLALAGWRG